MSIHEFFIIHHWRTFVTFTLCLTGTLMFFNLHFFQSLDLRQSNLSGRNDHTSMICYDLCRDMDCNTLDHLSLTASNLPFLVDELMRINHSVHNELIELEQRRRDLLSSLSSIQTQVEHVRSVLIDHSRQFMRLKATINAHEYHLMGLQNSSPVVHIQQPTFQMVPPPELETMSPNPSHLSEHLCTVESCTNWNHCLSNDFLKVCLYSSMSRSDPLSLVVKQSPHYVADCRLNSSKVCLQISVSPSDAVDCVKNGLSTNGPTCLALLSHMDSVSDLYDKLRDSHVVARSIIVAPYFPPGLFRPRFDILSPIPYELFSSTSNRTSLLPGQRSILLAFSAGCVETKSASSTLVQQLRQLSNQTLYPQLHSRIRLYFHQTQTELLQCWPTPLRIRYANRMMTEPAWFPCQSAIALLRNSTFCLVLDTGLPDTAPSFGWQVQLLSCLATGAVPVILGSNPVFPLDDTVIGPTEWSRAVLRLPKPRAFQLPAILHSIQEAHIVELRRQGRLLFERYFKDDATRLASVLLVVSRRLGFPQPPALRWPAIPAFGPGLHEPPNVYQVPRESTAQTDLDDFLGPIGPEHASPCFLSNFTGSGGSAHLAVVSTSPDSDAIVNPFWMHPSVPWDTFLPSDAPFSSDAHTARGLRPINHSINLAGYEFSMSLGGMHPYEQFTIIMLTYDRFDLACQTLERLVNLPYLHSVLVVWNHPAAPHPDLKWPLLHVPLKVIRASNNSLNNRFLPYNLIQTDAILSIDDDVQLRHDEIVFGFRVWREHRDRLVGFPVRSHFWNWSSGEWYYHSDYTCEFSMVLTGAAFFHKYYSFAYTWEMPFAIRRMVDERMNCEDLAMNFLIAHLTRKPPLKATIHWTFNCPTCHSTLHDHPAHYETRSKCINWLADFYGYNPLIYSQYRADSLLFKTRLPPSKQKCYKFI
uniref:Exostosin-like 3 protein n=2 Tax=Clonorchis sinensis TaxID=79923 RepID=H2KQY8_CLOSI|nr:Exostoses (Multiple)-like 3 [Clonorchis sinensis]GAA38261.2 exostosin-like 3 protein [Clonorchis sinensis]